MCLTLLGRHFDDCRILLSLLTPFGEAGESLR